MKPLVSAVERPDDYYNEYFRGAVDYDPAWRNYSYHAVDIPDGTVIEGCNFAQAEPKTECINGENLTFRDCNLCNVALHPSWTLERCLTAQSYVVADADGNDARQFICATPDEFDDKKPEHARPVEGKDTLAGGVEAVE